jgi:6-phosphogluconolactonase
VFNSGRQVIFLVAGPDKADALAAVFEQRGRLEDRPAWLIQPAEGKVIWMVDTAAAAKIRV